MIDAGAPEKRLSHCDRQLNQKRQVKLKTCADVYEHWSSYKRLYKKAPRDGVEFQIDYIDTGLAMSEEERREAPIALALHGAPGSYHDFSLLINHLAGQRVRVIAPNFPEYIATVKTKVLFRHSADEKAAYLRDFLKAINVKKIDLLVSHSSAIFPTLLILLNANNAAIARQQGREQEADGCSSSSSSSSSSSNSTVGEPRAAEVTLDSFSDIGNQLLKEAGEGLTAGAAANEAGSSSGSETGSSKGAHDHDDGETEFLDAIESIDGNNNNNNNNKGGRGRREKTDGLVIKLHQLDLEGRPVQGQAAASDEGARKRHQDQTRARPANERRQRGRRGRPAQEAVVHFDEPIEIRAVALFNPAGHRLPKSMKPTWFKCGSVHVYQHKIGRSLFRKFGPSFLTVIGVPVRVDNMDNVMLSATVMRNSKCQRVVEQLKQLSQMKIPTLLVFSENDKLIEKEIFYEMAQFMRLDSGKFDVFNNDGDIELSQSTMDDWIRVMVFKAGGHYAYSNYAKTVNKAVSELLARTKTTTTATRAASAS